MQFSIFQTRNPWGGLSTHCNSSPIPWGINADLATPCRPRWRSLTHIWSYKMCSLYTECMWYMKVNGERSFIRDLNTQAISYTHNKFWYTDNPIFCVPITIKRVRSQAGAVQKIQSSLLNCTFTSFLLFSLFIVPWYPSVSHMTLILEI